MRFIDTHSHLYLETFKDDIDEVISRAKETGVERIYLPAIDSTETERLLALEARYPGTCFAMAGLHPCSVNAGVEKELQAVEKALSERTFAAVGEIGLDFHWDKTYMKEQHAAFEQQIEWSVRYGLPIVIHSRKAMNECIATVKKFAKRGVKGIFHCFNGNVEQARTIIGMGMYLGIGGVVTYKNSGMSEVVEQLGLENLVLETDAPYLTPVPFRGKRNESAYLKYVAEKIALILDVPLEEVADVTTRNAEKIFGASL